MKALYPESRSVPAQKGVLNDPLVPVAVGAPISQAVPLDVEIVQLEGVTENCSRYGNVVIWAFAVRVKISKSEMVRREDLFIGSACGFGYG